MKEAYGRRFDAVVVWRFDRFARPRVALAEGLETFQALGIQFVRFSSVDRPGYRSARA